MSFLPPQLHYADQIQSEYISGFPTFDEESPYSTKSEEPAVKYIQPPNMGWKFGDRVDTTPLGKKWMEGANDSENWKHLDTSKESFKEVYDMILGGIQPRPIAFVSSISPDGVENIAPFSFFQAVCPWPPVIIVSSMNAPRVKDTPANIEATGDFTVNIISLPWIEQSNIASIETPEHVSEWEMAGLTKEKSTYVRAPRVKESAFSMECTFYSKFDIIDPKWPNPAKAQASSTVIYGLIRYIHVRKDVLNEKGRPDPAKLMTVSRMGDITYGLTTETFRLPRPSWKADGEEIERVVAEKEKEKEKLKANGNGHA